MHAKQYTVTERPEGREMSRVLGDGRKNTKKVERNKDRKMQRIIERKGRNKRRRDE